MMFCGDYLFSNFQQQMKERIFCLQIRDYRTDWNLEVNQPAAGNYYPVCFSKTVFCLGGEIFHPALTSILSIF